MRKGSRDLGLGFETTPRARNFLSSQLSFVLSTLNSRRTSSRSRNPCYLSLPSVAELFGPWLAARFSTSTMTNINLYAEVLTNIRQITLHASLQTTRNEQTQIEISSDKYVITVSHDGESASLYLPTQISGTANVTIPTEKKKELSLRLAIEDTSGLKPASGDRGQLAPWVAEELTSQTSFSCKGCNTLLLAPGKIMEWQNLPSESWHDMLDYWHCHKHGEAEDIGSPAQGENVGLVCVRPSLGLVDNTLFLLHPEDCSGTMVRYARLFNTLLRAASTYKTVPHGVSAKRKRPCSYTLHLQ